MPSEAQTKTLKIAAAAAALALGVGILVYQLFFAGNTPAVTKEMAPAVAQEEVVNKAIQTEQNKLELAPELPRESRAPRTVIGR